MASTDMLHYGVYVFRIVRGKNACSDKSAIPKSFCPFVLSHKFALEYINVFKQSVLGGLVVLLRGKDAF